jgi:hypothetical protein
MERHARVHGGGGRARILHCALVMLGVVTICGCDGRAARDAEIEARLKKLEAAAPGVGEVMSTVQLHFAKLPFAVRARNWDLASFEIDEVDENIERAAAMRPQEHGTRLADLADAFRQYQLGALRQAVVQQDAPAFSKAYHDALQMCNGCHRATGRPFIVLMEPGSPPVTNQQWVPAR